MPRPRASNLTYCIQITIAMPGQRALHFVILNYDSDDIHHWLIGDSDKIGLGLPDRTRGR